MSATESAPEGYRFSGFVSPQYTQIPDVVFDELAPILSGAEYKVLLYILRRTFGFKKEADSISYNQMLGGIVTRDGRRLDYGAGIKSRSTLSKALQRLEELNIILAQRHYSDENGNETTTYQPNMGSEREWAHGVPRGENPPDPPGSKIEPGGSPKIEPGAGTKNGPAAGTKTEPGPVRKSNPQETGEQKTEQQQVVALLMERGMTEKTAQKLAEKGSLALVDEKIAYLDFLQAARPYQVRRPLGWLRRAIEEDYAAPEGFEDFHPPVDGHEDAADGEEDAPVLPPAGQAARFGGTAADEALWGSVLTQLEQTLPAALCEHFREARLLSAEGGAVVLLVRSARAREWIQGQLAGRLRAAFRRHGVTADALTLVTAEELIAEGG